MNQTERHQEAIEYALNILSANPYKSYIDKIYMFGSCARKEQRYTSDVDLLVECGERIPPELVRSMRIAVMPEELDMPEIDLKFVARDQWRNQTNRFSQNQVEEGVL